MLVTNTFEVFAIIVVLDHLRMRFAGHWTNASDVTTNLFHLLDTRLHDLPGMLDECILLFFRECWSFRNVPEDVKDLVHGYGFSAHRKPPLFEC